MREHHNGMYRTGIYYISKLLAEVSRSTYGRYKSSLRYCSDKLTQDGAVFDMIHFMEDSLYTVSQLNLSFSWFCYAYLSMFHIVMLNAESGIFPDPSLGVKPPSRLVTPPNQRP
jgi:hypothetical protein